MDHATLKRIRGLAIPPAYEDGMDLQRSARPHPGHRARRPWPRAVPLSFSVAFVRDDAKFERLEASPKRCRDCAIACVATSRGTGVSRERCWPRSCLLDNTGSASATRLCPDKQKFRPDHTAQPPRRFVRGSRLRFASAESAGSSRGVVDDRRIVRMVRRCQELPGQHLLQYLDDKASGARSSPARSTSICVKQGRRLHGQGFPDVGRDAPCGRASGEVAAPRSRN